MQPTGLTHFIFLKKKMFFDGRPVLAAEPTHAFGADPAHRAIKTPGV